MTPLAPVSRAVPQERTPLNLLPPSQPRPSSHPEESVSAKEVAVVDSNKSYASLFGSKTVQVEQDNDQDRGHDGHNQSNQPQNQFKNQERGYDNERSDRPYGQNQNQNPQNSSQNQNQGDHFPTFGQRNDNQRERDGHWTELSNHNNSNNGPDDVPHNAVAKKRQLFDPKSNKLVDPEMHPENLPNSDTQKRSSQNQGEKNENKDASQDSLKRARPVHPRSDEFEVTWRRGVPNPKAKDDHKNNLIPPSDLAEVPNDTPDAIEKPPAVGHVAVTPSAVLARPQHVVDKQEEMKRRRIEDRNNTNKSTEQMTYSEKLQNAKHAKSQLNTANGAVSAGVSAVTAPQAERERERPHANNRCALNLTFFHVLDIHHYRVFCGMLTIHNYLPVSQI